MGFDRAKVVTMLAAAAAVAAIAQVDSWRMAVIAAAAGGAIAATRVRFSRELAVALLMGVAIVALAGATVTHDDRPAKTDSGKKLRGAG
jgi:hypothetical protein